jgi:hypothetical protein
MRRSLVPEEFDVTSAARGVLVALITACVPARTILG